MKLITRTNLYYLLFSVITYLGIVTAFYYVVVYLIYDEVETRLLVERRDFETFVKTNNSWKDNCYFIHDKIDFTPAKEVHKGQTFKDTLLFDKYDKESVPFRQLSFYAVIDSVPYRIRIRKSLLESDKLTKFVMVTVILFLSIALSAMFLFQRRISRRLWRPFYDILAQTKNFDISQQNSARFRNSDIFEFNELSDVLNKMTGKMHHDYNDLKEFTENASHEIQTPLAVINARIEELIQSQNLSAQQMRWIQEIYQSSLRISKLHQALLLLSKINNQQFGNTVNIPLREYILHKLEEYQEIFESRRITVTTEMKGHPSFSIHPSLADSLFTNLIGNAVKHNTGGGMIVIVLDDEQFIISNTGIPLSHDPEKMFERFKKDRQGSDSLGLGLAIVKRICENYGLSISYTFKNNLHTIKISQTKTA